MQPMDLHQIQNPPPRRSRASQKILDRQLQNIRVIVCSSKLVQQDHLSPRSLPPPKGHNLLACDLLQQFVSV